MFNIIWPPLFKSCKVYWLDIQSLEWGTPLLLYCILNITTNNTSHIISFTAEEWEQLAKALEVLSDPQARVSTFNRELLSLVLSIYD